VDESLKFSKHIILSGKFCEQLLANKSKYATLEIHDDYALYRTKKLVLFGRLIEKTQNIDIVNVFNQQVPKGLTKALVEIPNISPTLDRAIIVNDTSATDRKSMSVTVKDGVMRFYVKSKLGEVDDSIESDHPDV